MKPLIFRGVLLLFGLGVALGFIEFGLRMLYPDPRILRRDAELGYVPTANLDVRKVFGGHERVVRITTNSQGLRAPETALQPPASGVRRILALGDSFTFGHAVEVSEAWPAALERAVAERSRTRHEVVNAGVSGYGTGQQLLLYRRLEPHVRPDAVVLAFAVVNDTLDNACLDERRIGPRTDVPCFKVSGAALTMAPAAPAPAGPALRAPLRSLASEFFVAQAKRLTLWNPKLLGVAEAAGFRVRLPYVPETVVGWYDPAVSTPAWAITQRLLIEFRDMLAARGLPLVVLVVPSSVQVDASRQATLATLGRDHPLVRAYLADPRRPQRLINEFCGTVMLNCIDPLDDLLKLEARERTYYPLDGHWTPRSHALAARLVAQRFAEREIVR
jgi:lysophospholipase L1-like esterase